MDDSSFEKLAGRTIDGLFEALDAAIGDSAEIDKLASVRAASLESHHGGARFDAEAGALPVVVVVQHCQSDRRAHRW